MSEVRVYLGGEGANELGSRCGDAIYQDAGDTSRPGVIETLLCRIQPNGWLVIGAMKWCHIRKLRSKGPTPNEERNVLGLVVEAKRAKAQVLAFVRDADNDKERPKVIAAAIDKAKLDFPDVDVIGGAAIPVLEGWILAMLGESKTETLSKAAAQTKLVERRILAKDTLAMVRATSDFSISRLPEDANSLRVWLARARKVLPLLVGMAT